MVLISCVGSRCWRVGDCDRVTNPLLNLGNEHNFGYDVARIANFQYNISIYIFGDSQFIDPLVDPNNKNDHNFYERDNDRPRIPRDNAFHLC